MSSVKKSFIVIILAVILVYPSCSTTQTYQSPSAEIVGEWECDDYILDACAGEIDGRSHLFLLTQIPGYPSEATLRVLDMDDPANPAEVASQEAPMEVTYPLGGLVLSGNQLHIGLTGSGEAALWVLDVSEPASPREILLQVQEDFAMWRMWVSGQTLAIATGLRRHFAFFDISRPTEPRLCGQMELTPRPVSASNWHADYAGSMFYVVDKDGLAIVDTSSPAVPLEAGFYENPDWEPEELEGVEGAGTTVIYSTEDYNSFEELFENMFNSGCFVDVAVSDGYAYIAAADSGLVVLDVSDPESAEEVARLALPGKAMRVLVEGDLAYIMCVSYTGGSTVDSFRYSVHIADNSDPLAPEIANSIDVVDTFPQLQSLVTLGDYIYFIDYQAVYVVDIYGVHR